MKKLSALLLAFAMMLTMLSVASADDVQVIRMWSNDQHDQSVIKEKIEAFNATIGKENGIAVEYTVYGSDYYSTLDVAVTSKEGPDIFKCNKIGKYAEAGYILPWEEVPALSALVERFSSYNAPGYGEFFGQTYSVPIRVTTYGIACNNQIFEENNLELPKTWAEMEEAARVITQNSRGRKYGYALAMGYGSYHYFYVTLANGASVGDEYFNHTTGRYDFASLSGFLKHVRTFIDDGSMFPGYESMNGDTARAQFSAGNIGMIGVMSSDVTNFKNQFPCDFEWTMIPYPVADAEHYYKEPVGVSMSYVIGEAAKNYTDKVALFLDYLYSDEVFLATSDAQVDISILGSKTLGDSLECGVICTKYGHCGGKLPKITCCEGGHPIPDENSLRATDAALSLVQGLTAQDTVLFLLSGGGSALFEKPLIPLHELQDITQQLLASGASIVEINAIRKRLSAVKGGRFAKLCQPARVFSIVLSDILGDPLDMIASGPACPDASTCSEALSIAARYHLRLSPEAMSLLHQETPKALSNVETHVTGSVRELCAAAAAACSSLGYTPIVLTDVLACQARDAGQVLSAIARTHAQDGQKRAFLMGGETVVHVTGHGKGGRNQELALAAAQELSGITNAAVFSIGSDGTDGPTDAAGGYVDGDTASRLSAQGISIAQMLQENNAYHALEKANGLIFTGPTGTNVNDVAVLLIDTADEYKR